MFIPIASLNKPPAVLADLANPVKLSALAALIPAKVLLIGLTNSNVVLPAALNNCLAAVNFSKFFKLVNILPPYLPIFQRALGRVSKPFIAPTAPPTAPPATVPSGPANEPSIAPIRAYSAAASVIIPAL